MTWVDILWPMLGAASLTLGLIHVVVGIQRPLQANHLAFACAAAAAAALAVCELLMMRAGSVEEYAEALRWAHPPVVVLVLSLIVFVRTQYNAGAAWLALAVCVLRLAFLGADFASGTDFNFASVEALQSRVLWSGAVVSTPLGQPNPLMLLGQLSNIFLLLFLLDAIHTVWRRDSGAQRRQAIVVCSSIALFLVFASLWAILAVAGKFDGPLSVNAGFVVVLLAMSYDLGGDVIRARALAVQVASSEAELRVSEQRMQLAVRAANLGLWTLDLESGELWLTETGTLMGWSAGERIESASILERVHPEDRARFIAARQASVQSKGDYACEFRIQLPEGGTRWISASGRVECSTLGEPQLITGVVRDITERRQAEERFRLMVDSVPTAMLLVDNAGRISLANAQAQRLFDCSSDELLGKAIDALVPTLMPDTATHGGIPPDATGEISRRSFYGLRKGGDKVAIEVGLTPFTLEGSTATLVSVADIRERLRLEREAAVQREELAHLSRVTLLGELAGSLAHELNQPLTVILSNAQAALRFLDQTPPDLGEVRDSLKHIVQNDKRASEVIRRVRTMLRKEAVAHEQIDLNEVVQDAVILLANDAMRRGVSILLDLHSRPARVSGDRVQLQQVLVNLILNACDAMADVDGPRVLTMTTRPSGEANVELMVADTGKGIPHDQLETVFSPFVTTKREGLGLGLAICQGIVHAHHGSLWATNNEAGATMHVELPDSREGASAAPRMDRARSSRPFATRDDEVQSAPRESN